MELSTFFRKLQFFLERNDPPREYCGCYFFVTLPAVGEEPPAQFTWREDGLGMKDLASECIEDPFDHALESSTSAFSMGGENYQVPNLQELHTRTSA